MEKIQTINASKTLEDQLRKFKEFVKQIETADDRLKSQITNSCVKFYFKEKIKHPAKLAIQNVFNLSKQCEMLTSSFVNEMKKICQDSSVDAYHFISCLNEAMQNFEVVKSAISIEKRSVVEFLSRFVNNHVSSLTSQLSPARKNEISTELHSAMKLTVCILNTNNEDDRMDADYHQQMKVLCNHHCKNMLLHEELPLDAKNICGLVIWEHSNLFLSLDFTLPKCPSENVYETLALWHGRVNMRFARDDEQLQHLRNVLAEMERMMKTQIALDPTVILAISRIYAQASKKSVILLKKWRLKEPNSCARYEASRYDLRSSTLPFFINHIDHHIDTVRHLAKETLENIVDFAVEADDINDFVHKYHYYHDIKIRDFIMIAALPKTNPLVKFDELKSIHRHLGDLYGQMQCLNSNFFKLYEVLSEICKKTSSHDEWFEYFVLFLLQYQDDIANKAIQDAVENLLFRQIGKDKQALQRIIEMRDEIKMKYRFYRVIGKANKAGGFDDKPSTSELWHELLPYDEIKSAMVDGDERIRSAAFSLIVESKKITQELSENDFDCIFHFLKYNVNVQSPSTRQNIFGMLKNLFERVQAISQIVNRKKLADKIDFYFNFLHRLQLFCLDNLFEGANFSRRVLSLRILYYVLEAMAQHFASKAADAAVWDQTKFDIMLAVFNDSYEANKEMMIEIMQLVPRPVIVKHCTVSREQIQTLAMSIKPPESLTAAYLAEFYAKFILNDENSKVVHSSHLTLMRWCIELLREGLTLAEKSLIVASSLNPLYGLIYTVRHLIGKLNLTDLAGNVEWREFFSDLIPLARRLTEVVAPVVNSSAPEGILPREKIDGVDDETAAKWMEIVEKTTPQMILLCCWRTVKEVSLMLGDIASRAPVIGQHQAGLLTVDEMKNISEHFLDLLSNTKHRGAFEQCFFGFSQLCLRLWTSKEDELHQLPSKELQSLIGTISGETKENELLTMKNLCSTRRSAGLPFVIQALITSELKVGKNHNFHFVMSNLVKCARAGEHLETRTHSLNILRALFRCSDLGEPILAYIEDGIRIAIQGYEASSWIERNSSTLLFASLMVRIFGVQKTKDDEELNIRNKMTGRIFFLRYPKLYDFFMEELEKASKFAERAECNSKLHPLLLILNRLYPSSLEGSESNLKVEKFIPHVTQCSGCVEQQTRILCAKFIANVLRREMMMPRIREIIDILKTTNDDAGLSANFSHGLLLQIFYMVKKLPTEDVKLLTDLIEQMSDVVENFKQKLICYATILDIHLEVIVKNPQVLHNVRVIELIKQSLVMECNDIFGASLVAKNMILLQFCVTNSFGFYDFYEEKNRFLPSTNILSNELTKHQVSHTLLNIIMMGLNFGYANEMAEDYEISKQELDVGRILRHKRSSGFNNLLKLTNDYLIDVKVLDIMALSKRRWNDPCEGNSSVDQIQLQNQINSNLQRALRSPEHLKKSLLKHVHISILELTSFDSMDYDFLPEISTDSSIHVK